ncbi:hypothetical protein PTNB73_02395 [Pyrenophora teres f. teres]|nr:hypothetical protein HRS9139_00978 [Pyrenophora teres f. teres]KAE8873244.1 hypothetical protein PTNB73_02395 [Pyrenophora teres f. teres]
MLPAAGPNGPPPRTHIHLHPGTAYFVPGTHLPGLGASDLNPNVAPYGFPSVSDAPGVPPNYNPAHAPSNYQPNYTPNPGASAHVPTSTYDPGAFGAYATAHSSVFAPAPSQYDPLKAMLEQLVKTVTDQSAQLATMSHMLTSMNEVQKKFALTTQNHLNHHRCDKQSRGAWKHVRGCTLHTRNPKSHELVLTPTSWQAREKILAASLNAMRNQLGLSIHFQPNQDLYWILVGGWSMRDKESLKKLTDKDDPEHKKVCKQLWSKENSVNIADLDFKNSFYLLWGFSSPKEALKLWAKSVFFEGVVGHGVPIDLKGIPIFCRRCGRPGHMSSRCENSDALVVVNPINDMRDIDDGGKSTELWPCLNCGEAHIAPGDSKCKPGAEKVCLNCKRGTRQGDTIPDIAKGHDTLSPICPNPDVRAYYALCCDIRQSRPGWTAGFTQPDYKSVWSSMDKAIPQSSKPDTMPRHPAMGSTSLHDDEMPPGPWDDADVPTFADEAIAERGRREQNVTNQEISAGTLRDAFEYMKSRPSSTTRSSSAMSTKRNKRSSSVATTTRVSRTSSAKRTPRSGSVESARTLQQAQLTVESSDPVDPELLTTVPSETTTTNTERTSTIPIDSRTPVPAPLPDVSTTPHAKNTLITSADVMTSIPVFGRGRPITSPARVSRSLSPMKRRAYESPETAPRSPSKRPIKQFTSRIPAIDSSMRFRKVDTLGTGDDSRQPFPTGSEAASSSQPEPRHREVQSVSLMATETLVDKTSQQDGVEDEFPFPDEGALLSASQP